MSKSGNAYIAKTQGAAFTMYAVMRSLGIPLTEEQKKLQKHLELKYGMFRSEYPIYDEKSDEVYKP